MGVRRFALVVLVSVCAFACPIVVASGSAAAAAAMRFGEPGSQAGQFQSPAGVAVDATGNVYVGDSENQRVDTFNGTGHFLLAWGAGVANRANELQTCMSSCIGGLRSSVTGGFTFPTGIAVDNELSSASYGDVYVVDHHRARVEKYGSQGEFLLMLGGHVNKTTGGNVCVAGETCQEGMLGTGDGEFSPWPFVASFIAVGPGGDVYVGDQARLQVFEASGAWKENISLSGLSSTGRPSALAVDATGDVFVKDEGVAGVRELEPGGIEKSFQFDAGGTSITALALDSSGNVYVGDSSGGFHVLEYDAVGTEVANFGSNTVVGSNMGLAYSEAAKQLYASAAEQDSVWVLTPPPPGPLIDSESATPGLRGTATLEAMVDPEGNEANYHFEYVDEAHYQSSGFASASSTPTVPIASGLFEDHAATINLTGLVPGATYHYRIVTHDTLGHTTTGPDQSFEPTPPALIEGPWATNVAATSATLAARINPLGAGTDYRLEYGTSTSYGHVFGGNVGKGMSYVSIGYHLQELEPDTTYHYRLVTISEVGIVDSVDHTFTTQPVGGELALPDGRAWELVSPANKKGGLIEPFETGLIQAASDGSAITYLSTELIGEGGAGRNLVPTTVLSRRGQDGWRSQDLAVANSLPPEGEQGLQMTAFSAMEYRMFSPDLTAAVVEPWEATPLSAGATERTLYLRDNLTQTYLPLVTASNAQPGAKFGGFTSGEHASEMHFVAATPDLSHVVLESPFALTPEAIQFNSDPTVQVDHNMYEWSKGRLQLVNILPSGETINGKANSGIGGAFLGGTSGGSEAPRGSSGRAISNDGRWIAWTDGTPYGISPTFTGLYVRDMVDNKTLRVGGSAARYQTMSSDGSEVYYLEGGELYEFDTGSATSMDLTAGHGSGANGAGVKEILLGISEMGSYVYFVAGRVLAEGAVNGGDNLYVAHYATGAWTTSYIATLSGEDEKSWYVHGVFGAPSLPGVTSRVSPNGRYLAFMSDASLTGYDNVDAISGQRDQEVYIYDAVAGRLVCASCDPTGARPVGIFGLSSGGIPPHRWAAANIPGWRQINSEHALYQPRYLSDSGRLFFESPDALVAQDTNGLEDVYEYEPASVGNCTSTSLTFSARSLGCVGLVSSGQSATVSTFMDASENGDDVFFVSTARLTGEDYDTGYDVYDSHACSIAAPCQTVPVSPPPCTSGDSCKAAPSPQPAIFGPAPSATFSGVGNVVEEAKKGVVKRKKKIKGKSKRHAKPKKHKGKKAKRSRTGSASGKGTR
jgi:hypothetical protein